MTQSTFEKEIGNIQHYSLSKTEVFSAQSKALEAFEEECADYFTHCLRTGTTCSPSKIVEFTRKHFGTGG